MMMGKYVPENAVVTDPVVGEVTLEGGVVKNLHASGLTTAKEQADGGVNIGAAPVAQVDGADEAAAGAEQSGESGVGD